MVDTILATDWHAEEYMLDADPLGLLQPGRHCPPANGHQRCIHQTSRRPSAPAGVVDKSTGPINACRPPIAISKTSLILAMETGHVGNSFSTCPFWLHINLANMNCAASLAHDVMQHL